MARSLNQSFVDRASSRADQANKAHFILTGKWAQRSERCGRMVPSLMMKALATSMYEKVIKEIK